MLYVYELIKFTPFTRYSYIYVQMAVNFVGNYLRGLLELNMIHWYYYAASHYKVVSLEQLAPGVASQSRCASDPRSALAGR